MGAQWNFTAHLPKNSITPLFYSLFSKEERRKCAVTSEVLREPEKIFEFGKWGIWPKSTQFTSGRERLKTTAHRAPRTFFAGSIFPLDPTLFCVA